MRSVIFAGFHRFDRFIIRLHRGGILCASQYGFFGFGQHIHHDLVRSGFGCFGECFFGDRKHPDWACPGADIGQH